jgi:DNA-binding HxlR family transcriptional regulator
MSLNDFAEAYSELTSGDQQQLSDAVRRLLSEGLIWREDEHDRPVYNFLVRRRELVAAYLSVAGWELRYDERIAVFQVVHREGAHRRRLNRDTTIWLLLLRLIYAEKRERVEVSLTRYPTISIEELYQRYTEFLPGQAVKKKTSLDAALRTLQSLKLIRAGGGGTLRASEGEKLLELLPTLEVVVPGSAISEIAERLQEYDRSRGRRAASDDEPDDEDT